MHCSVKVGITFNILGRFNVLKYSYRNDIGTQIRVTRQDKIRIE